MQEHRVSVDCERLKSACDTPQLGVLPHLGRLRCTFTAAMVEGLWETRCSARGVHSGHRQLRLAQGARRPVCQPGRSHLLAASGTPAPRTSRQRPYSRPLKVANISAADGLSYADFFPCALAFSPTTASRQRLPHNSATRGNARTHDPATLGGVTGSWWWRLQVRDERAFEADMRGVTLGGHVAGHEGCQDVVIAIDVPPPSTRTTTATCPITCAGRVVKWSRSLVDG